MQVPVQGMCSALCETSGSVSGVGSRKPSSTLHSLVIYSHPHRSSTGNHHRHCSLWSFTVIHTGQVQGTITDTALSGHLQSSAQVKYKEPSPTLLSLVICSHPHRSSTGNHHRHCSLWSFTVIHTGQVQETIIHTALSGDLQSSTQVKYREPIIATAL